ncbi:MULTISPECIES: hypothetical protein [Pseudomonas]|uniref:hypothetical protein n=1 Tax=Pseudomonas nitroreducens TaxID=46680 RepID=UPI00147D6274|nr:MULTISPECIES: hypothetical protein [Pseudomonas]NNN24967.1 hypothetical protein [Pseudomonas nitroreducens]
MLSAAQQSLNHLSPALLARIQASRRVILLANNPAITREHLDALALGPDDLVVSFNKCRNRTLLRRQLHNLFIHRHNYRKGGYFGFPYKGWLRLFPWFNKRFHSVLLGGEQAELPASHRASSFLPLRQPFPALEGYPYERLPTRGGPSTGFYAVAFFDYVKRLKQADFEIVLVGFSDEGGSFWDGHAWDFEREWTRSSDVTVIKL